MEITELNMIITLVVALGFGSSLIHYNAYAKSKAKVRVKSNDNSAN